MIVLLRNESQLVMELADGGKGSMKEGKGTCVTCSPYKCVLALRVARFSLLPQQEACLTRLADFAHQMQQSS